MPYLEYQNLTDLLHQDGGAYKYFSELPEYVRQMINDRGGDVHTMSDLQNYADNLLSGDK